MVVQEDRFIIYKYLVVLLCLFCGEAGPPNLFSYFNANKVYSNRDGDIPVNVDKLGGHVRTDSGSD